MTIPEIKTVTIEGVELASTGYWEFSTGPRWLEQKHLEAAVEAQADPAIKTPIIKIGHTDPRFDGQPLLGSIVNLRLSENKQTLLGDYVIAQSLSSLVAKAPDEDGDAPYPDRSIEAQFDYKTSSGNEYLFVLTGVALLGQEAPAIEDLDDIIGIFTDEGEFVAAASSSDPKVGHKLLLAGATVDRIRLGVWETIPADDRPWGDWSWVRALEIEDGSTGFCIVEDDDTAKLYRLPWTVKGDEVEYGDPIEVVEQFVAASSNNSVGGNAVRFRSEFQKVRGNAVTLAPDRQERPGAEVDLAELRTKLGLPDDADEAAVSAKLDELKAQAEAAPEPPAEEEVEETTTEPEAVAAGKLPEGVVAIDKAQLDELKAQAKQGADARERQRIDERDRFIGDAIKAGKFPPARKQYWSDYFDRDEKGAREFIESLEAGAVPLEARGHSEGADNTDADTSSYPGEWLTDSERERVTASSGQGA